MPETGNTILLYRVGGYVPSGFGYVTAESGNKVVLVYENREFLDIDSAQMLPDHIIGGWFFLMSRMSRGAEAVLAVL